MEDERLSEVTDFDDERLFEDIFETDALLEVDERWLIVGDWGPLECCLVDPIWLVDPSPSTLGGGLIREQDSKERIR